MAGAGTTIRRRRYRPSCRATTVRNKMRPTAAQLVLCCSGVFPRVLNAKAGRIDPPKPCFFYPGCPRCPRGGLGGRGAHAPVLARPVHRRGHPRAAGGAARPDARSALRLGPLRCPARGRLRFSAPASAPDARAGRRPVGGHARAAAVRRQRLLAGHGGDRAVRHPAAGVRREEHVPLPALVPRHAAAARPPGDLHRVALRQFCRLPSRGAAAPAHAHSQHLAA